MKKVFFGEPRRNLLSLAASAILLFMGLALFASNVRNFFSVAPADIPLFHFSALVGMAMGLIIAMPGAAGVLPNDRIRLAGLLRLSAIVLAVVMVLTILTFDLLFVSL